MATILRLYCSSLVFLGNGRAQVDSSLGINLEEPNLVRHRKKPDYKDPSIPHRRTIEPYSFYSQPQPRSFFWHTKSSSAQIISRLPHPSTLSGTSPTNVSLRGAATFHYRCITYYPTTSSLNACSPHNPFLKFWRCSSNTFYWTTGLMKAM
jgi:hypothetical protein